jgi:hypothetical protein
MFQVSHLVRAVALVSATLLVAQAQAASSSPQLSNARPSALTKHGGVSYGPAALSETIFDVTATPSYGEEGAANNFVTFVDLAPNARVVGIGWDVNVSAFDPSWLSELTVSFLDSTMTTGVNLSVGVGDTVSGLGVVYSSGGVIDLTGLSLDFNVGADGKLRLEFFEGFDDAEVNPDGNWNTGALTIQTAAVPEPATYGLMALGLIAVGAVVRRRNA